MEYNLTSIYGLMYEILLNGLIVFEALLPTGDWIHFSTENKYVPV